MLADWKAKTPWVDFLAGDPAIRSNTSVCLKVVDPAITALAPDAQADFAKKLVALVEKEGAGYDFAHYRDAPAGLRIWCGATVEARDVALLTQWIDWAFTETKATLARRREFVHPSSSWPGLTRPSIEIDGPRVSSAKTRFALLPGGDGLKCIVHQRIETPMTKPRF